MLTQVFGPSQVTTIAANAAAVVQQMPSLGARSYRIINTTTMQVYIYGDGSQLVDVIPPGVFVTNVLRQGYAALYVTFDPNLSGQVGPQAASTAWGVWIETYHNVEPRSSGTLV